MKTSDYARIKAICVGGTLIFTGLVSMCLGVPSATMVNGNYPYGHLGYGIWGGFLYLVTGIVAICAGCKKSPSLIMWTTVLAVASVLIGLLQMSLGITAAAMDFTILQVGWMQETGDLGKMNDTIEFTRQFLPMNYFMLKSHKLADFVSFGTVAVDSLLAISGFLTALFASLVAASGFRVICCPDVLRDYDQESPLLDSATGNSNGRGENGLNNGGAFGGQYSKEGMHKKTENNSGANNIVLLDNQAFHHPEIIS